MNSMSPQQLARIGGRLYLVVVAARVFAEFFIRSRLIMPGDDVATALEIVMSASLFRVAVLSQVLMLACDAALALVLFRLLASVHRELARLTTALRLASIVVSALNVVLLLAVPVLLLGNASSGGSDLLQQQQAAMTLLRLHTLGYQISTVFLGLHCVLLGGLIYASGYFPRALGVPVALGGVGYLFGGLMSAAAPPLAALAPGFVLPGVVGELWLTVGLTFVGVNVWRWHALAVRARERRGSEGAWA